MQEVWPGKQSLRNWTLVLFQVSTKPPLCCIIFRSRTTEFRTQSISIVTEVVNSWACYGAKFTASTRAVDVKKVVGRGLPKCNCSATSTNIPKNVCILYRFAIIWFCINHDVEVADFSPEVILIIDCCRVLSDVAGCPPVGGIFADFGHSIERLAVDPEVWTVLVDGCIFSNCLSFKIRQLLVFCHPGHD